MTTVYTIGHSNRALDVFIHLLTANGIQALVDVRKIPRSRYNPQFNDDALPSSLSPHGVSYLWMPELGGRRSSREENSPNKGWRSASFRAYADYMMTDPFQSALANIISLASQKRPALMCAEAVPWRCHRSLIADALLVRHVAVWDIIDEKPPRAHSLPAFARVEGVKLTYPEQEPQLAFDLQK